MKCIAHAALLIKPSSKTKLDGAPWPHQADIVVHVPRPGRHHNIVAMLASRGMEWPIGFESDGYVQGFITESGVFLDRIEAEAYAREHGQLNGPVIGGELTSEDLW